MHILPQLSNGPVCLLQLTTLVNTGFFIEIFIHLLALDLYLDNCCCDSYTSYNVFLLCC
jgi:hypothetical protein